MSPLEARCYRRQRAACGTRPKLRRVQRQHAPSPFRREQGSQLVLADLSRRVRHRGSEGEAQQVVPASVGEHRGKLACEPIPFDRSEQVEEAGIDDRAELPLQERRTKGIADAELNQRYGFGCNRGHSGASLFDCRRGEVKTQNRQAAAR